MGQDSKRICIGVITSAHGIRGDVKIHVYLEDPWMIGTYQSITGKNGSDEYNIKPKSLKGDVVIASVNQLDNRNDAERLRHKELYILRSQLPQIKGDDEFYIEDLIGLDVRMHQDNQAYGTIAQVHNHGASDLLEIKREDGGKNELYAFTKAIFPTISMGEGYVTFQAPELEYVDQHSDTEEETMDQAGKKG